ncbi:MAG: IS1634 family transposase [Candidatus Jacksonbacteria bacterium]
MYHIRTTKTGSGATAIQVVRYENRKMIVVAHIGSAHTPSEIKAAKLSAKQWIDKISKQRSLFPVDKKSASTLLSLQKCHYLGFYYNFSYEIISQIFIRFKFHTLHHNLLTDLALMRIIEPASKLQSLELLKDCFGVKHLRQHFYQTLPNIVALKEKVETRVLAVAKKEFNFDFSLIFYDVTTLYFESFAEDEFRKKGFSKDHKINQPQILIALIVNTDGFPIAYEIFKGNTFEGHTIIPAIKSFQRKHKVKQFVVVADAAMLSQNNLKDLEVNNLCYIVGARLGNMSKSLIKDISNKLGTIDGATLRLSTQHGNLICGFSLKRFRKDKHEMKKQIQKAQAVLQKPSKIKRLKFVQNIGYNRYQLNTELMTKAKSLLGIKGYYTNLSPEKIDNNTIINRYHQLWHVEQAFRLAKSDLQIRPIYHFKKDTIKAHLLICFMALAISKYLEIKTGKSVKKIVQLFKKVTDARILNTLTNQEIALRSDIPAELKSILSKLDLSY